MKRCQGLTLDKMNQVDKKLSPISHVTVNDIKFLLSNQRRELTTDSPTYAAEPQTTLSLA